ncbi:cytochrome c oxidase subunit II [Brevibacillus sp. H7]|uniref:cytochrome c oxidase subunit II n=1 Tax=Brevibacillus sp. H7 TaxID=3349138 RepID=UPI003828DBF9
MDLPRYERIWLWFGVITLVIFLLITGIMAFSMELHPANGHVKTVAPEQIKTTPPFDKPGIYSVGKNEYKAVMVAQAFNFLPIDPTVPKGSTVHFHVTSPDVIHGIAIPGTNANMMILPGHVTEFTYTFHKPGEYLILCNEYCGVGHQVMMAKLIVK